MAARANLARVETRRSGPVKRPVQKAYEISPASRFENPAEGTDELKVKQNIAFILDELGLSNQQAAEQLGVETFQVSAWRAPSSGKNLPHYLMRRFTECFGERFLANTAERCGFRLVTQREAELAELADGIISRLARAVELAKEAA